MTPEQSPEPFEFFTSQPVKCITCIHKGSMKTIGESGLEDFDSAENETELQQVLK